MAQRALIVVTNHADLGSTGKKTGWYLSEVTHVYYPLIEAGYHVDFASPRGGVAPLDEGSVKLEDPDNERFVLDAALMASMQRTLPLAEIDPADYEVVHFAGGHGVMWDFPGNVDIERVAAGIFARGGVVAAVCHGPAALVDVKLADGTFLVSGQEVSAFTNAEEVAAGMVAIVPFALQTRLEERGARHQAGPNWSSQVSVSGRLITGQNPQSAKAVGERIVEVAGRR